MNFQAHPGKLCVLCLKPEVNHLPLRIFIDQTLQIHSVIALDEQQSHYVLNVHRLKKNHACILFNGRAPLGNYNATVIAAEKRKVRLHIQDFVPAHTESPLQISLLQGIAKNERMDFCIQKSVELGVSSITPVWMQRTNVKLNDPTRLQNKLQHWQKIAHSAMEQSGRSCLVPVHPPCDLSGAAELAADLKIYLDPYSTMNLEQLQSQISPPCSINILIGPEGGLSPDEREFLSERNFKSIRLGPRILRTETAGMSMISLLQYLWGDL